jgi:sialate O-acetylesterase
MEGCSTIQSINFNFELSQSMKKSFTVLFLLVLTHWAGAVSLPKIFSNNMVLQRDVAVRVWGWSEPKESITITFNNFSYKTKADNSGRWFTMLPPSAYGGPYEMKISGKSGDVVLKNILIGDVWVGSGQSNMEWTLKNTKDADVEIAKGNYPMIRLFTVKKAMSYQPEKDLAGGEWLECNSENVKDFSAVAYFFGRKLNDEVKIPIGLINSSWGGTNVQTWISWDVMGKKDQYKTADLAKLQASTKDLAVKQKKYEEAMNNERGLTEKWQEVQNPSDWKTIKLPQIWESTEIGNADGYVWFRREFMVNSKPENEIQLSLGPIDDQDQTFLNGKQIGETKAYNQPRIYSVKPELLNEGKNVIAIRVLDTGGGGGVYGKPDQMFISAGDEKVSLAGEWQYKPSVLNTEFGIVNTGPNSFPSLLYNAMIAPFVQFPVKGVIWYQGESNTWEAYRYRTLFKDLILDWRGKWGTELPFFWVQLANFMQPDSIPSESQWAELREAQSVTTALPKTGQAVIIDVGEADDIHPRNKQDVGLRLALTALKITYDKSLVYSGPVYKAMGKKGDKIEVTFDQLGSGLWIKDKYGYVKGFTIAGADQKFVWANAYVEGDKIVVFSPNVKDPIAVRYAWGNNPDDANVFNKEGLPAAPFRTDTWKGISEGQ